MIVTVDDHIHADFCCKMSDLDINLEYLGKFRKSRSWSNELGYSVPKHRSETYDVYITAYFDENYVEYRYRTTSSVDVATIIMDNTYSFLFDCGILV
ncbi:hypothetical protein NVP2275O_251 [Vibrio phage 2.275.O._10N.286.54.E11]|nr:hypothetical protein NVP2275O_251 [Vibrio phage 2.275.O._10N.286.54.E11]